MVTNIRKIISKSGDTILEIDGYLTNSKYNPKKEVKTYIDKHYKPNHLNIVFGYGMGYLVDELVKRVALNEKILVIDPLLEANLLPIDYLEIQNSENIIGFKADNIDKLRDFVSSLDENIRTQFNVFCTHNYDKIFVREYKSLLSNIKDAQYYNMISDNTNTIFSKKWQKNISMNLVNLTKDANLIELKKQFNKPVVVASSGPSLNKQLSTLKKYRSSFILISAGSTTNVLLNNNIEPDFIVSIDGGEANYEHFKGLKLKETRFIYILDSHYKIRDSFENQAFVCTTNSRKELNKYVREELNLNLPELFCSFTVATLSFSVALYITTGPVALIGQDLAFTDNLTHSVGHNHMKKINENDVSHLTEVIGYYGDKVFTDRPMYSMKQGFEQIPSMVDITNSYYNCTEGGVKIFGFPQMSFQEFCEKFQNHNEKIVINNLKSCLKEEILVNKFEEEIINSEECLKLYSEAINLINKDNSIKKFKESTLKKLNKIDEKLIKLLKSLSADTILNPISLYVKRGFLPKEKETVYQEFNRVKKQNLTLYTESKEAINTYLQYIKEAKNNLN